VALVGEVARLLVRISADNRELDRGLTKGEESLQSFVTTGKRLLGVGGLVGAFYTAGKLIGEALELGEVGSQMINLERSRGQRGRPGRRP